MKTWVFRTLLVMGLCVTSSSGWAQGCDTRDEVQPEVRAAIDSAAQKAFDLASRGDVTGLRDSAILSLQSNFNGVSGAVNDNKAALTGAKAQVRTGFVLDTGNPPPSDGRFYCGVFGAGGQNAGSAAFEIPNLPQGKYAIVIQDFTGSKGPYAFTTIFQEIYGKGWKLAGLFIRPEMASGHDGLWYLQRAREYKAKSQNHNAWFFYLTSWDLLAPVTFMDSALLSKVIQESNTAMPKDVPADGKPVNYSANGRTYNITEMSVYRTDTNFDLSVRYSVPSTADSNAAREDARGLATALTTQYPELKEAFNNVWVHAVDPSGGDVVGLINLKPAAPKP